MVNFNIYVKLRDLSYMIFNIYVIKMVFTIYGKVFI
jgi:hypothetical protein